MLAMIDETKRAAETKTRRKLEARERLKQLASAPSAEKDPELARLKYYLSGWAALSEPATLGQGAPTQVPYSDYMRATPSWALPEGESSLDASIRKAIDESVMELSAQIPLCRACLMVRYMNVNGPAVYRSGRMVHLTGNEIEDMADQSELALVPIVKRRGVYL